MLKSRPILFSAPMVRALLDGSKTQTRRIIKRSGEWPANAVRVSMLEIRGTAMAIDANRCSYGPEIKFPYGHPGDRLWVRETFQPTFGDGVERSETDWDTGAGFDINYPATTGRIEWIDGEDNITDRCKPAIHMPRWCSRITLEITGVRVERLHAINEVDAIAEGAPWAACGSPQEGSHKAGYALLWESINGPNSWELNPWVWVIEFKRVTP